MVKIDFHIIEEPHHFTAKTSFPDFCTLQVPVVGATSVTTSNLTSPPILISSVSLQPPLCKSTADGSIRVTVAETGSADSYSINGGMDSGTPVFENLAEGVYSIRVKNKFGCLKDTVISLASPATACTETLFIPSAFTPDGNGLNDVFRARSSLPVSNFELRVYNRYGENVFTSYDTDKGWDGLFRSRLQPTGVYAWLIRYRSFSGRDVLRKGTVALLR